MFSSASYWLDKRKVLFFLVLVAVGVTLLKPEETNAHLTGGQFKNLNSGLCIDVYNASTANGAQVIQWTCHGNSNQQLRVEDAGGGLHYIKFVHSDKCLEVYGASTADGGLIVQWDCWGAANQKWQAVFNVNGSYEYLYNANSGMCIDVEYQSPSNGAILHQWGPAWNCGNVLRIKRKPNRSRH